MEKVTFDSEDGVALQGELRLPEATARGSAVVCHAHPQFGGSKDHPLLWAIRNELVSRGLAVLSFNFRGVMGSDGEYTGGTAEVGDSAAAIGVVRERARGPTLVCGWSFGASVALRLGLQDERVDALGLLGMPLGGESPEAPPPPPRDRLVLYFRPVLLVSGEADPFCPVPELRTLSRKLPGSQVTVMPDTDHFFWRREREVATIVGEFTERSLGLTSTA